jgi:hypothetical protein
MKHLIILIFYLLTFSLNAQNVDYSYISKTGNSYICNNNDKIQIRLQNGFFEIASCNRISSDILNVHSFLECPYSIKKDTLFVQNGVVKMPLKITSDGILFALTDIEQYIKKGDKLYCNKYFYKSGRLMLLGGDWKNDLKEGKWIYFDESGKQSGLIFKNGFVVDTFKIVKTEDPIFMK